MEQQVEQTTETVDSTASVDSKLDRFFEPEQEEVQQDPAQGEEQAAEQTTETEASAESETQPALEEVEWDGEKYQLPPKLKSALMRQEDYTKKTQEVAEARRMVELQIQRQKIEKEFQQSVEKEMQSLSELDAAIKQYGNVDWQALDTDALVKTRHALDMLKERRSEFQKMVEDKRGKFEGELRETHQKSMQQANEYLSKAIPKWGIETQKELISYGMSEGYTDVELNSIRDPKVVKTMWKAQQWDKLQAAKPLAAKRASGVPPVVRPGATKPVASPQAQYADTVKQLHQAKDPDRKKALLDKSLDLKLSRMLG